METKITLALADDELLFRQGINAILSKHQDFEVLFDAADGSELINLLRATEQLPQIVITDLNMPELSGVEVTKIIKDEFPDIKIIALTSYFTKPFVLNMISSGAVAYLAKNSTPKLMIHTILQVAEKGFYYDETVLKFIQEGMLSGGLNKVRSKFDAKFISRREREVLELICQQFTTPEIAEKLFISPRTVEGHRTNLLLKTDSKNIAGLVVFAIQNEMVDLNQPY